MNHGSGVGPSVDEKVHRSLGRGGSCAVDLASVRPQEANRLCPQSVIRNLRWSDRDQFTYTDTEIPRRADNHPIGDHLISELDKAVRCGPDNVGQLASQSSIGRMYGTCNYRHPLPSSEASQGPINPGGPSPRGALSVLKPLKWSIATRGGDAGQQLSTERLGLARDARRQRRAQMVRNRRREILASVTPCRCGRCPRHPMLGRRHGCVAVSVVAGTRRVELGVYTGVPTIRPIRRNGGRHGNVDPARQVLSVSVVR